MKTTLQYREINKADRQKAIKQSFTLVNETLVETQFVAPESLLVTMGLDVPPKQTSKNAALTWLKHDDPEYDWDFLANNLIPPVVVKDGNLLDGIHRCRLAAALGESILAACYFSK